MNSTFCPPGDRTLYAQHRSFRIIPSSPFRLPTTILEKSPCSPLRNHSLYFSLATHHSLLRNTSPQPRSSILRGSLQDISLYQCLPPLFRFTLSSRFCHPIIFINKSLVLA